MEHFVLMLLPVGVILAGVIVIIMSSVIGRKAMASLTWPSVTGTVLVSQMVEETSGEVSGYSPLVTYSYAVSGQALQSSRVAFVASKSKKVVAKYPKGSPVQVYFDPQQPSKAVLEKGGSTRFMVFLGVALILGGCLGFIVMI